MPRIKLALFAVMLMGCGDGSKPQPQASKPVEAPQEPVLEVTPAMKARSEVLAELPALSQIDGFGCATEVDQKNLTSFLRRMHRALKAQKLRDTNAFTLELKQVLQESEANRSRAELAVQALEKQLAVAQNEIAGAVDRQAAQTARAEFSRLSKESLNTKQALRVAEASHREKTQFIEQIKGAPDSFVSSQWKENFSVFNELVPWLQIRYQFGSYRVVESFDIISASKKDQLYTLKVRGVAAEQNCQPLGYNGTHQNLIDKKEFIFVYDSLTKTWTDADAERSIYFCGELQKERAYLVVQ